MTISRIITIENLREYVRNEDIHAIDTCLNMLEWKHLEMVSLAVRDAILLGKLSILQLFLNRGLPATSSAPKNDNERDISYEYIYFAGLSGNIDMVKLLVAHGAKIDKDSTLYDDTTLKGALEGGHEELIRYLLANGASADGIFKYTHETFISYAARNDQTRILELLLKHVTSLSESTLKKLKKTHPDLANKFILNQANSDNETHLVKAIKARNANEVSRLVSKGADVNERGSEGTPLHVAASQCFIESFQTSCTDTLEIIQILLSHGADPNLTFDKYLPGEYITPLEIAGLMGSPEAFALLLPVSNTARLLPTVDLNNNQIAYPWYTKVLFKSLDLWEGCKILSILQSYGANLNQHNYKGETILHIAMRVCPCDEEKIDFLLNNCNPSVVITHGVDAGDSALHTLLKWDYRLSSNDIFVTVLDKFMAKGFDINTRGSHGETLLHLATKLKKMTIVSSLLARGANVNIMNDGNLISEQGDLEKAIKHIPGNKQKNESSPDFMRFYKKANQSSTTITLSLTVTTQSKSCI